MATRSVGFTWRMQLYAVLIALVLSIAIGICPEDTALLLYIFLVAPLLIGSAISLAIFVFSKKRRQYLGLVPTLAVLCAISAVTFLHGFDIRSTARWLVWSNDYKARVLAQPEPRNGELRHIEWDGWGEFAQDFSVFLVFDPNDSLSGPAKKGQYGKFNGIPCEVDVVHRMDSHWYTVLFEGYVDPSWNSCR
jgi:hypothetical protein